MQNQGDSLSDNHGSGGAPSPGWGTESMICGAMSGRSPSGRPSDKKRHTKNDAAVAKISARNGKENKVNRNPQRSGPESHYNDDQRAHEEEDNEETRKNSSSGLATSKTAAKRSLFFNATTSYNSGSVGISGNTGVHSFHDIKSSVAMKRKTGNDEEAMTTGKRMKAPSSKFGGATDQVTSFAAINEPVAEAAAASKPSSTLSVKKATSSSPPLSSLGASTTAAQKKKDDNDTNGTIGDFSTLASKPSPPPVEPHVNFFQRPDDQSATNDLSSSLPPSHSSSTSITTITPSSSLRSCCINIPKPSNKKYSSDRATFLTSGISNPILATKNNTPFWDNLGRLQTITHNEDQRGGDDGQKKPYDKHVLIKFKGRPVLRAPPASEELLIIKRIFPHYKDATLKAIVIELQHYYSEDGRYYGHLWHGMNVSLCDEILFHSEVGLVSENEQLLQNHIDERMNILAPASPHWSGLLDIEYSCDVPLLQTFASSATIPFLLGLSATEWNFYNALVQASLGLTPHSSRSPASLGPNATFARNDAQASASFDDVMTRFADVVSKSGVVAYLSAVKHDMGRISMWDEPALKRLCSVEKGKGKGKKKEKAQPQRQLVVVQCAWNNGDHDNQKRFHLHALIPSGQLDKLQTQLRLLVLCASFVYSPKSIEEMKSLLVGIYWKGTKIQQRHSVAELVTNMDLSRDTFSAIIGYVTTENIPPKPKCARLGCNNFAAPNPDGYKRGGRYDHLTCNEPGCADRCAWHANGVRCSAPRTLKRMFCGGEQCTTLYTGTQAAFRAEINERKLAKEMFC